MSNRPADCLTPAAQGPEEVSWAPAQPVWLWWMSLDWTNRTLHKDRLGSQENNPSNPKSGKRPSRPVRQHPTVSAGYVSHSLVSVTFPCCDNAACICDIPMMTDHLRSTLHSHSSGHDFLISTTSFGSLCSKRHLGSSGSCCGNLDSEFIKG